MRSDAAVYFVRIVLTEWIVAISQLSIYCVAQSVDDGNLVYCLAFESYAPCARGYYIRSRMEEFIYKAKVLRCVFAFVYVQYCMNTNVTV